MVKIIEWILKHVSPWITTDREGKRYYGFKFKTKIGPQKEE